MQIQNTEDDTVQMTKDEDNLDIWIEPQVFIKGKHEGLTHTCDDSCPNNIIALQYVIKQMRISWDHFERFWEIVIERVEPNV